MIVNLRPDTKSSKPPHPKPSVVESRVGGTEAPHTLAYRLLQALETTELRTKWELEKFY